MIMIRAGAGTVAVVALAAADDGARASGRRDVTVEAILSDGAVSGARYAIGPQA